MRASVGSVLSSFMKLSTLQGEEPVFGDGFGDVGLAARQHRGDLAGDDPVVRQRHALEREAFNREIERRLAVRSPAGGGRPARASHSPPIERQSFLFSFVNSSRSRFMVMPSPSRRIMHVAGFLGRLGDRGHGDLLEGPGDRRHRPGRAFAVERVSGQHLLAAAPARQDADTGLDEAGIGLGVGLHRRGVEQQFAAAAQRHARGRGDDREGSVFHRLHRLLAVFQHAFDHRPDADIGGEQGEAEIGADGKVGRPRCRAPAP